MEKLSIRLHVNKNGKLVPIFKVLKTNNLEKKTRLFTDHDYIDFLINKHISNEEYEECEKLLKIKKITPKSDKLRNRIV